MGKVVAAAAKAASEAAKAVGKVAQTAAKVAVKVEKTGVKSVLTAKNIAKGLALAEKVLSAYQGQSSGQSYSLDEKTKKQFTAMINSFVNDSQGSNNKVSPAPTPVKGKGKGQGQGI